MAPRARREHARPGRSDRRQRNYGGGFIENHDIRSPVTGKLDLTRSAVDHSLFLSMDDAYALAAAETNAPQSTRVIPGYINAILVKAAPDADPEMVGAKIQQPFSSSYVRVIGRNFALEPASQEVRGLPNILNMISIVVVLASLPLIALITAMVTHERQRRSDCSGRWVQNGRLSFHS